jgi:hypothetical protein
MKNFIFKFYAVILALVLHHQLGAQNVYIDLNNQHQGIDGVGFCHEGDRQNGNTYVINGAIQEMLDNHMTIFRDMFPNRTFAPSRGVYNYTDARVVACYQRLKIMQDRGIKTILGVWDVPNWLVSNPSAGSNRKINNMDDFANVMTAFLVHGKNQYGLNINFIDVNETKTSAVNIGMTSSEYALFIEKCQPRFTSNGLLTRVNIGSVLLWDLTYNQEIYNRVRNLSVAGYPSWHTYRGGSLSGEQREPISYWQNWGAWQQTLDRNLWGTETDYDAYYWKEENPDVFTWTGAQEMAVMYYRNYYVARMSTSAGWFWHSDYPSHNVHIAYMNHFEPGGQIVETSQPDATVMTVAYKHVANQKFVIQVLNESSSSKTVNFYGVPSGQPLTLIRTNEAGDRYRTVGTYTPNGTTFTITLQPNSFNTFYGNLGATCTSPPPQPGAITGNTLVPAGSSQTYSVAAVSGATSYTWSLPSGWSGSSTTNSITTAAGSTGGTISVTANNACGTSTARTIAVSIVVAPTNLALNKPVTASSTEAGANVAANAVDGSMSTRWSSLYADPQWIYVDLQSSYDVSRVKISWEAAYASAYQIQISTNASTWTTMRSVTGNTSLVNDQTGLVGTGRYVRINGTARATQWGYSIFELEVNGTPSNGCLVPSQPAAITGNTSVTAGTSQTYSVAAVPGATSYTWTLPSGWSGSSATASITTTAGSTGGTISVKANNACGSSTARTLAVTVVTAPTNIAYNRPVVVSSIQGAGFEGSKAVDANGTTRWSSASANNQNFVVDLGATYNINRIRIAWEAAYARDYQIQISSNNSTWTTIREFWGKTSAAPDDYIGLNSNARWLKVYCINRATTYGFSIFEFEAYGTYVGAREASVIEDNIDAEATTVYPNPANDKVTIHIPAKYLNGNVALHNAGGKTVISESVKGPEHTFDLMDLPSGLYIIHLSVAKERKAFKVFKK